MDLGQIFKDLLWDALVAAALKRLFAAVPWLGWGPIGVLVTWIVGMFADEIFSGMKLAVDLEVIAIRNEIHRREYTVAAVALRSAAINFGTESPQFKEMRLEKVKKLSEFVQFHVAA